VSTTDDIDRFALDWDAWHRDHETRRADPHGFLAVTGLYWLGVTPVVLPDVPGRWTTGDAGPVVELGEGETLVGAGVTISGRHAFGPIEERGGSTVESGEIVVEVAKRGGQDILRPRRPDHPYLLAYSGTPAYPAETRWRRPARFVAFEAPRPIEVGSAIDGLRHVYEAPGFLEFELDGITHRLTAFSRGRACELFVLFTDATSGVTTYAANRSVAVDAPDVDGVTVIDFNRAVEPSVRLHRFRDLPAAASGEPPADPDRGG
jgi:uncharacterized protein (DUF1684 family)